MTTHANHRSDDSARNTGLRCAECRELIPSPTGREIHSREIDDVVVHFCGPGRYQRWLEPREMAYLRIDLLKGN
ncbi:MAG: hypothetical protein ACU843_14230 [Gammaproteobacteria bacterium]